MALSLSVPFSASRFSSSSLKWKSHGREFQNTCIVKPVLNSRRLSSFSDFGASKQAGVLPGRVFAKNQKHGEHDAELGVILGKLESNYQAALVALKEADDHLREEESRMFSEFYKINLIRKDLKRVEEELGAAELKQGKVREELRLANDGLASRESEIRALKLRLKEGNKKISGPLLALSAKEKEITKVKQELKKKSDEAANAASEIRFKLTLLDEANQDVEKRAATCHKLLRDIKKKTEELKTFIHMRKTDSGKLKISEANFRKKTRDLEYQIKELEEEKERIEMGDERVKLRVGEAQNKELRRKLLLWKRYVAGLQMELEEIRSSLKPAVSELYGLQVEIDCKTALFEQSRTLINAKVFELVETGIKIQNLKPEHASLQLRVDKKDRELMEAKETLFKLRLVIYGLKTTLSGKADELIESVSQLKENDGRVLTSQHELSDGKLKSSEPEAMFGKIVDLTKEVVASKYPFLADGSKLQELEAELELSRERLRKKEMDVRASQKDLIMKNEELKIEDIKLGATEEEMGEMEEELRSDDENIY